MLRCLVVAGVAAVGCTGAVPSEQVGDTAEADTGETTSVAFLFPTECTNSEGANPCTQATYEELARRGQGIAFETTSANELSQNLISLIGDAAPEDRSGLDIVLLIDGTGSMVAELAELRQSAGFVAAALQTEGGASSRLGLAIYRDMCVDHEWFSFQDLTLDFDLIRAGLNDAHAYGGGDMAESIYEAIGETSQRATWINDTRAMVIIGDSYPHDDDDCSTMTMKEAVDQALDNGVGIYTLIVPQFAPL